jgi:hypothetical protein
MFMPRTSALVLSISMLPKTRNCPESFLIARDKTISGPMPEGSPEVIMNGADLSILVVTRGKLVVG